METQNSVLVLLSTTFVTMLGAMAKLLSDIEHKKITKAAVIGSASFALFAGALIGSLGMSFGPSAMPYISALGGIVGWAGKAAMDRFTNRIIDAATDKVANTISSTAINEVKSKSNDNSK